MIGVRNTAYCNAFSSMLMKLNMLYTFTLGWHSFQLKSLQMWEFVNNLVGAIVRILIGN